MADIIVQAVKGATVYDNNFREIPSDRPIKVKKTMHIIQALRDGSLKEFEKKPAAAKTAAPKAEKKEA